MRKLNKCFSVLILAGIACAVALPVQARSIAFKTPTQLKGACVAAHGDYNAPGYAGVYSCQLRGGGIIACGGKGEFARTCESSAPRTILNPILVRGSNLDAGVSAQEPATFLSPAFSESITY